MLGIVQGLSSCTGFGSILGEGYKNKTPRFAVLGFYKHVLLLQLQNQDIFLDILSQLLKFLALWFVDVLLGSIHRLAMLRH